MNNKLMEAALAYVNIGWHILPCWWIENGKCACGKPDCTSPGKHPIGKLVQNGQDGSSTSPEVIQAWWSRFPKANIAVHLAPSGLCAIDIDPRNGGLHTMEHLEGIHGPLMSDLLQFTGGGGEHRYFLLPVSTTMPGKLGPGVDVKVNGYAMLEPSNHVSGGTYGWEASSDPRDGILASPMPDWLRDLAGKQAPSSASASSGAAANLIVPQQMREDVEQALTMIPADDRDTWLHVGMALHSSHDKQWAFQVWDDWSQKSRKYDPVDQMRVWRSIRSDKTKILSVLSIFRMAKMHSPQQAAQTTWAQSVTPEPAVSDTELSELAVGTTVSSVDKATMVLRPMPVESLNELAAWVSGSFSETNPFVSQAAAIAMCCAAASRRYVSIYGDPASLYVAVVAPSVSMGRHAHFACDSVFFESGVRCMVRATRVASPQQLFSTLYRTPACLYLADDYGSQLKFAKRQPSGLLEQSLSLLTGRIASGQTLSLDNWAEVGMRQPDGAEAQPVIYAPTVTMLALLGTSHFAGMFRSGEFASGAADSVLIVPATDLTSWIQRPVSVQDGIPPHVIANIKALRGFQGDGTTQQTPEQLFNGTAAILPSPIEVHFTGDIQSVESAWIAQYANKGHNVRQLASGARRNLRRLCTAIAAWANPSRPVATPEIVNWCADFVRQCLDCTIEEANLRSADDSDKPDVYQKVLEFIDQFGAAGVAKREVISGCKAFRAMASDKRDALIGQMLDDEAIRSVPTASGRGKNLVRSTYTKVEVLTSADQVLTASVSGSKQGFSEGNSAKC